MGHYGIGELTSVTILAELGDVRRFSSSRQAVRYAGLDITVTQSDKRRAPGTSPAKARPRCAGRSTKPPRPPAAAFPRPRLLPPSRRTARAHRACLAIARKLLKRSYHTLRELGERHSSPHELPSGAHASTSNRCTAASSRHAAAATPAWTASKD